MKGGDQRNGTGRGEETIKYDGLAGGQDQVDGMNRVELGEQREGIGGGGWQGSGGRWLAERESRFVSGGSISHSCAAEVETGKTLKFGKHQTCLPKREKDHSAGGSSFPGFFLRSCRLLSWQ
jgi:hypothetical protein